ncbi:MAG: GldG family protein [Ruminococcus sp.]|nr:GldG family protein [Ruminococcus sp.]
MKNNENIGKKPRNFKKFKYGSMSVVVIALVIAIVVVINIIAGMLMKRYPLKLDLTADKRYELCDETINALKEMDKDVEITVTTTEDNLEMVASYYGVPYDMIPAILENYQVYAQAGEGNIDVQYIDVTKDPDVVAKYKEYYNGDIGTGYIVVYSGERVKLISLGEMFSSSSSSSYYQTSDASISFVGESALTSAIMSVTDANPVNAAFATYMNQAYVYGNDSNTYYCVESFKSLLASGGYDCTDIDVMTDDISVDEYDLVVIPAPSQDFGEDVIAKLEDFLYNDGNYGKHVIYIANVYATDLPNIEEFLAKWNIQVEDAVIVDDENMMNASLTALGGQAFPSPIVTIADTEAVGTLPNENLPVVAPLSRELTILDKNSDYVTSAVLTSASTSYLTGLDEDSQVSEEKFSRNIAVLSKRERAEQFDVYTSSVLVIGSSYMTDSLILDNTNAYNNANMLLNAANTMTGKENSFVIPQKELQEQTLALTANQAKNIRNIVMYGIPLVVVAVGVVVFIRRKNR